MSVCGMNGWVFPSPAPPGKAGGKADGWPLRAWQRSRRPALICSWNLGVGRLFPDPFQREHFVI